MTAFASDIHGGVYPSAAYLVEAEAEAEMVTEFTDWLSGQ